MSLLQNGQTFPSLEIPAVGGGTLKIPEALAGSFGLVVIYRGHWCPFCNQQLASIEAECAKFAELGIKTIAFSVDDEATTAALAAKNHLSFPLGHSADVETVVAAVGSFVGEHAGKPILQPAAFLLAPNGTIMMEVYASGPLGRMMGQDVAGVVAFIKSMSKS